MRSTGDLWKLAADENGGLRAQSFKQLLSQLDVALADPDCCRDRARDFVQRYVTSANGESCARVADVLRAWVGPPTHAG